MMELLALLLGLWIPAPPLLPHPPPKHETQPEDGGTH